MTRDEIIDVQDLKRVEVPVPEWGDGRSVYVREMSAIEREEMESLADTDGKVRGNTMGRVAAMTICDVDGNRLFTLDDAQALGSKNIAALKRVFDAAVGLSKLTNKEMEKIEGNSSEGLAEDSTSA
jgi:hypothetical protein